MQQIAVAAMELHQVDADPGRPFGAGDKLGLDSGEAGRHTLEPLVATLKKAEYDEYGVELAGHTDTDPIRRSRQRYRDNWDLGAMRANSVRQFLVEQGLPAERLHLSSWGSSKPMQAGQKRQNRRVEILLHHRTESLPASAPRAD